MRRLSLALAALVLTTGCTPELEALVRWLDVERWSAGIEGLPCHELAGDVAFRGLPEHFLVVIERESHCNPAAVNASSGALGLTQIMPFWLRDLCPAGIACTEAELLDPAANLDAAAYVYAVQGPSAWSQTW